MVDRQTDRCARWIKDAMWIREIAPTMNRDEGLQTKSRVGQFARHAILRVVKIQFLMVAETSM